MTVEMIARGPDGCGTSSGPGFALGHRRLSVIDLAGGRQPMSSRDGSIEVVFNGEIYNYQDLRRDLETKGYRFTSASDTETLLHGYDSWGLEGLLKRLRGMYGFAIVDRTRHEIHLARDPVGKKPLMFRYDGEELVFASTVRSLIRGLKRVPDIDKAAIDYLLTQLYIPGPLTILQGVEKLMPGHALSLGQDGRRREIVHWRPDFLQHDFTVSDDEWMSRTEGALQTAVKRRLIADVPIGILLSGGVDSSLVTAAASQVAGPVATFSVRTDDPTLDESRYATAVARRWGTKHHTLDVRSNARSTLPRLVAGMGEPLADASLIQVFAIAAEARKEVTVVLTGDGGDEVFGGYAHYLAYHFADLLRARLPRVLNGPMASLGAALETQTGLLHRAATVLRFATDPGCIKYSAAWADRPLREMLYTGEFRADVTLASEPSVSPSAGAGLADQVMQAQFSTLLPDDYLAKVDNGTMAVGLEARSPFLDLDLITMAMQIPARCRFRGGRQKSILRRLALKNLPHHTVRRRKRGFVTPVGKWLRNDWRDLVDELLLGRVASQRGWFQPSALKTLVQEHNSGHDHGYLLWALVVLELWVRLSLDRTLSAEDTL